MKRKIPFLTVVFIQSLFFLMISRPVWAGENPANAFVRFLKTKNYARAYELLSPNLKSQFSLEKFEAEQKEAEIKFAEQFGASEILRAEEIVLKQVTKQKSVADQMRLGDVDLSKFLFWNWWKSSGPKRCFFQFVFGEEKRVVFGVDTRDGKVVNYEFLPRLQAVLSSKNSEMVVKKTRVVA